MQVLIDEQEREGERREQQTPVRVYYERPVAVCDAV